jgi:hypothetical protein
MIAVGSDTEHATVIQQRNYTIEFKNYVFLQSAGERTPSLFEASVPGKRPLG